MGSSTTGGPAVQSPQPEWSGWRDHRFAPLHQFMVPLPLFPSSVFAGTRPHPWSSLEPSSSPSYCCEFSKCCSCRFPPPSTVFSSLCSDGEKEYIFPLPSAHHQQGCLYGKVQAAPGGHREVGFSPRGTFVQAEMLSAQPEQGSPGILMLLGWIDLRLNSTCPSPCRLVL